MRLSSHFSVLYRLAPVLVVFVSRPVYAQSSSLSLGTGSAMRSGSVTLNLSLSAAPVAPAGLQWTVSFPSDVASISSSAGAALTAAGKSLNCNPAAGKVTCLVSGMNTTEIGAGTLASLQVTLAPSGSNSTVSLPLSNVMGSLADGTSASVSGTGGSVTVTSQPA